MIRLEELERQKVRDNARDAALSGLLSGAGLGAAASILGGKRRLLDIAKTAVTAGLGSGALSGAATYTGGSMLGPADEEEANPNARRGALGGALGGALLGGAAGAALGRFGVPKALLKHMARGVEAVSALPKGNLITDKLLEYAAKPGSRSALSGGLLGAGGLGAAASYLGADEGMQLDAIQNEIDAARRRRQRALEAAYG